MDEKLSKRFQKDAQQIVDTLFESKMLREDIKRNEMTDLENLIEFMIDSRFDSYVRARVLAEKYSNKV